MPDPIIEEKYSYHRAITVKVLSVSPTPVVRTLPQVTKQTINLQGGEKEGEELIAEIRAQIERDKFFSVTIDGEA